MRVSWIGLLLAAATLLNACGGADSTSTSYSGGNLNDQGQSPAAVLNYVQAENNIPLLVDAGVTSAFALPAANALYASVNVCEPGGGACQLIDHVLVDTGSIGLRVMASKVATLNLPSMIPPGSSDPLWECYPFVVGGLWGNTAVADIGLGPLTASSVPVQLIQDNASASLQAPSNCVANSNGQVMSSAADLGANGIIGIGSVTIDCGLTCVSGNYGPEPNLKQYYTCPVGASSIAACQTAAVPENFQTYNPVAAINPGPQGQVYNNGIVIRLPAVGGLGAATVSGELIFGINSASNNQLGSYQPIYLGTDASSAGIASYLSITTVYNNQTLLGSYLDTGSNALFFNDSRIKTCAGGSGGMAWYCPSSTIGLSAQLSDGQSPAQGPAQSVNFTVASADSLFFTSNTAFGNLAGTAPADSSGLVTFAWGLPFYYGRIVYQSIWDLRSSAGPWVAFGPV